MCLQLPVLPRLAVQQFMFCPDHLNLEQGVQGPYLLALGADVVHDAQQLLAVLETGSPSEQTGRMFLTTLPEMVGPRDAPQVYLLEPGADIVHDAQQPLAVPGPRSSPDDTRMNTKAELTHAYQVLSPDSAPKLYLLALGADVVHDAQQLLAVLGQGLLRYGKGGRQGLPGRAFVHALLRQGPLIPPRAHILTRTLGTATMLCMTPDEAL